MEKKVKIPEGVEIGIEGLRVKVKGPKGELERDFSSPLFKNYIEIRMEKEPPSGEEGVIEASAAPLLVVRSSSDRRKIKAMVGTIAAHIRNMIKGVTQGYTYKLKAVYVHFPISLELKGNEIIIKNFLGERTPRKAKIVGNVNVKIQGQEIIVEGINKEEVGQTAANLEQATKVKNLDRRLFQDGIYLVSKE